MLLRCPAVHDVRKRVLPDVRKLLVGLYGEVWWRSRPRNQLVSVILKSTSLIALSTSNVENGPLKYRKPPQTTTNLPNITTNHLKNYSTVHLISLFVFVVLLTTIYHIRNLKIFHFYIFFC